MTKQTSKRSKKLIITLMVLGFIGMSGITLANYVPATKQQNLIHLAKGQQYHRYHSDNNC